MSNNVDMSNADGYCVLTMESINNCPITSCDKCKIYLEYKDQTSDFQSVIDDCLKDYMYSVIEESVPDNNNIYAPKEICNNRKILELDNLNRVGLITLISSYDNYIKDIIEDGDFLDRTPVCISEYLNNDFIEDVDGVDPFLHVDYKEQAALLIDNISKVLDSHNIKIPDVDREDEETESAIYGTTYHKIEDEFIDMLNTFDGFNI